MDLLEQVRRWLLLVAALVSSPQHLEAQNRAVASSTEGYVQGADNVRLFYRRIEQGSRVAVLLHGGPGSNMNGVWPDLEPLGEGRTVVMYDQRGSGRSDIVRDAARLRAADHVGDLEALRARLGIEKFTLIGESWGAGLAILYAGEHPDRVDRLLLLGPMPPSRAIMNRRIGESAPANDFRRRLADVARTMSTSPDPIATCREFFSVYLKQFFVTPEAMTRRRNSSCDAPAESVRNYFVVNDATLSSLGDYDFRPVLARLTMPAMVIEGDKSIPSTVESARVIAGALENATLVLVPGAGHFPQVERPDIFFPTVEAFLNRDLRSHP